MDFNTLLLRLGVDTDNFENKEREPVITKDGFIYEVEQRKDGFECPYCHFLYFLCPIVMGLLF